MLAVLEQPHCGQVRIVNHLGQIAHRHCRDLRFGQDRGPFGAGAHGRARGDFAIGRADVAHPRHRRGKPFVLQQVLGPQQREQPAQRGIGIGHDADMPVGRGEGLAIGIDLARIARRLQRRHQHRAEQVFLHHEMGERLEHRNFDELPFAKAQAVDHRGQDRIGAVQPRHFVRDQRGQVTRRGVAIDPR